MFKMESVDDSDATDELSSSCDVVVSVMMSMMVCVGRGVCVDVIVRGLLGSPDFCPPNGE